MYPSGVLLGDDISMDASLARFGIDERRMIATDNTRTEISSNAVVEMGV